MTLIAAGISLGFVALCSLPAAKSILLQPRHRNVRLSFYQDEDGSSPPEAIATYSTVVPKALILIFSLVGSALSIVLAVHRPRHIHDVWIEAWLNVASWV